MSQHCSLHRGVSREISPEAKQRWRVVCTPGGTSYNIVARLGDSIYVRTRRQGALLTKYCPR